MNNAYLIALGSNRRHIRYGRPRSVLHSALQELDLLGTVISASPIIRSDPIGPAQRRFANAVCILECALGPYSLLEELKRIEKRFGRKSGRLWGDRVLDLDILLWDNGKFSSRSLSIPHSEMRQRRFVLDPASAIAPDWRDPLTGWTIRQLAARISRPR